MFSKFGIFFFRSHWQPHCGADPCLCRGYFQKTKIRSAMEVASSYKLISLLKTAFNAYNAYNVFTALKSNTAFFACTA